MITISQKNSLGEIQKVTIEGTLLHTVEVSPNTPPIRLIRQKGRYIVTYGLQVQRYLSYEDAAKEIGESIMHAIACDGKLD